MWLLGRRFPAEVAARQAHEKPHSGSRVEAAPSVGGETSGPQSRAATPPGEGDSPRRRGPTALPGRGGHRSQQPAPEQAECARGQRSAHSLGSEVKANGRPHCWQCWQCEPTSGF